MRYTALLCLCLFAGGFAADADALVVPSDTLYTEQAALQMTHAADSTLAPVYDPLAEQITADFGLAEMEGIGIDLGSGPGDLIIALCKRTKLHWVNADINPHFFPIFCEKAKAAGVGARVSAIFADAQALPFRDNYAAIIVSRGCYFFWQDKPRAFAEVYRVLKPGGVAYIGRGFSRDLPVAVAEDIRDAQKKGNSKDVVTYDPADAEKELRQALDAAGIADYTIERPTPPGGATDLNYGIWVTIRKAR